MSPSELRPESRALSAAGALGKMHSREAENTMLLTNAEKMFIS